MEKSFKDFRQQLNIPPEQILLNLLFENRNHSQGTEKCNEKIVFFI